MKKAVVFTVLLFSFFLTAPAQNSSPSDVVVKFYRSLREKKYLEGFRLSIYRGAIEGLTAAELQELEPEFARTFAEIPEKIETKGEQINGNTAVVFLKFAGVEKFQQVALIKQGGDWLVGDEESLAVVKQQGRAYFFTIRMDVNEDETYEMLQRIVSAQVLYASRFEGKNISLAELVRLQALPADMEDGESGGYRYVVTLGADQKSFQATATPTTYGKTGRLSFYADLQGVRAADLKGEVASKSAPPYQGK